MTMFDHMEMVKYVDCVGAILTYGEKCCSFLYIRLWLFKYTDYSAVLLLSYHAKCRINRKFCFMDLQKNLAKIFAKVWLYGIVVVFLQ